MSQTPSPSAQTNAVRAVYQFDMQLPLMLQAKDFYCQVCHAIAHLTTCTHAMLYVLTEDQVFQFQGCKDIDKSNRILRPANTDAWRALHSGKTIQGNQSGDFPAIQAIVRADLFVIVPVIQKMSLTALIVIAREDNQLPNIGQILIAEHLAIPIRNALFMREREKQLQKRLQTVERETEIFRQIDTELSNNIDLNYIFSMIMDWSLRFTNADVAALLLYDAEHGNLRLMAEYGYPEGSVAVGEMVPAGRGSIALRVARQGKPEIIPSVASDPDYVAIIPGMQSLMIVPIYHEEKVIAIVSLESRKPNGFTTAHLEFVRKLANRAGVSVDNARLFTETHREREKLSNILRNIAEIVIATDFEDRIILINSSARLAFRLALDTGYIGESLSDVISHSKFLRVIAEARDSGEETTGEIELENKRVYHMHVAAHTGIGRIIVMQDITYFKETDRLKTELVATVSHDLKQPLSVMRGYIDLLEMVNDFDERSNGYIANLNSAFDNMRQLIDDLLDIARIEAGLSIEFEDLNIADVLYRSIKNNIQLADKKSQIVSLDLPPSVPAIKGDPVRLEQIFNNLISNAIKYTPPSGNIRVAVENRPDSIRISVQDNGMGIGPEDITQIFERFFRVRRPETDSIEGTGLGLAIVKSLIEVHRGRIDVRSKLGSGSTFRVSLPISTSATVASS